LIGRGGFTDLAHSAASETERPSRLGSSGSRCAHPYLSRTSWCMPHPGTREEGRYDEQSDAYTDLDNGSDRYVQQRPKMCWSAEEETRGPTRCTGSSAERISTSAAGPLCRKETPYSLPHLISLPNLGLKGLSNCIVRWPKFSFNTKISTGTVKIEWRMEFCANQYSARPYLRRGRNTSKDLFKHCPFEGCMPFVPCLWSVQHDAYKLG